MDKIHHIFQSSSDAELCELLPHNGICTGLDGCKTIYDKHQGVCENILCRTFMKCFHERTNGIKLSLILNTKIKISVNSLVMDDWDIIYCSFPTGIITAVHDDPPALEHTNLCTFLTNNPTIIFDISLIYRKDWDEFVAQNPQIFPKFTDNFSLSTW